MDKRDEIKNKIQIALSKNKGNDFWNNLIKLLGISSMDQRQEVLDILGRATITNPDLCGYIPVKFDKILSKSYPAKEVIEMETYVIQNYILYPNEPILATCWGKLVQKNSVTSGRFYLTPYRVVVSGPIIAKRSRYYGTGTLGIVSSIVNGLREQMIQTVKMAVRNKLGADMNNPRGNYGDTLLIFNTYEGRVGPKRVQWNVNVDYADNKGRQQIEKLEYKLEIKKAPKQDSKEFEAQWPAVIEAFKQIIK
jgi:hypothetical protein